MSLINPALDTTHIIKQAMNAKSIAKVSYTPVPDFETAAQRNAYYTVAQDKFGYRYSTPEERLRTQAGIASKKTKEGLCLDGYSSAMVQSSIKRTKSPLKEADSLKNVTKIEGDCNLKGTSLENLANVKEIKGALFVDTKSKIKDLSSLKKIMGSVWINAKDEKEMLDFIKSTGLSNVKIIGRYIKG